MKKKELIGTISGKDIMLKAGNKPNRTSKGVSAGTGYHKSVKDYNRKSKTNQRLKNKLKNYGSEAAFFVDKNSA